MSDSVNAQIAQGVSVNPLTAMQQWQAYRQAQAATQGQDINNQLAGLNVAKQGYGLGLMGVPVPGGAAGNAAGPALSTSQTPGGYLPNAQAGASASKGQPAALGALPSSGTIYQGIPMPLQSLGQIITAPDQAKATAQVNENRRQIIYSSLVGSAPEDYVAAMSRLAQQGWVTGQQLQEAVAHPEGRSRLIMATQTPETYQSAMTAALGQGMQYDPATGQPQVSSTAVSAAGQKAGATATAEDQARLRFAQSTAQASGLGDAATKTATVYVPGPPDKQGNPTFIPKTMSQLDALAYVRGQNGGGATPYLGGAGAGAGDAGAGSNNIGPLAGPIPNQDGTPPPGFNGGLASTAPAGQPSASTGYLPPRAAPATQALGPNSYLPPNAGAAPGAPPVNQLAALTPPAPSPAQSNVLAQIAPNLPPAPVQRGPAPQGLTAPPGSLANQSAVTGGAGVAAPSAPGMASPGPAGASPTGLSGSPPGLSPADTAPGVQSGPAELSPAGKADLAVTTAARTAEQEGIAGAYGEQAANVIRAGSKAADTLSRLDVLDNAAATFRPGANAETRLAFFRNASAALQTLGINPPKDWVANAAAGETIDKEGGWLGAQMTQALGSREAASVFQAVARINPTISMSTGGFPIIVQSIRQGALRDQDLFNYQENWLKPQVQGGLGNSTTSGMMSSFNKQFPPESYASRIVPFPQPSSPSKLLQNVFYKNSAGNVALWNGSAFVPAGAQ